MDEECDDEAEGEAEKGLGGGLREKLLAEGLRILGLLVVGRRSQLGSGDITTLYPSQHPYLSSPRRFIWPNKQTPLRFCQPYDACGLQISAS